MTRLVRAAATRSRRVAQTVASRWSDAVLTGRRARWDRAGRLGVPDDVWPATPDSPGRTAPLGNRMMPLPPAWGLSRWLWGDTGNRNDGGDRSNDLLAVYLDRTDLTPGNNGCFATTDAVALVADRAAADTGDTARGPHTLMVVADGSADDVAKSLRDAGAHRGCLVLDDPGSERRAALLSLCAAVAVPAGTDPLRSPWAREAGAAGVALLTHTAPAPLPRDLGLPSARRVAGRVARHTLVSADPTALEPVPGPLPERPRSSGLVVVTERRRVVVAGHDLKFARGLIEHLRGEGHEVRLDEWAGHERHDPRLSRDLAGWADAVLCEWALGNAVWYSRHVTDGTQLTVRLHLQEAATAFPARVRADRIDAAVFVSEHLRRQVVRDFTWPAARSLVVPNAVRIPEALESTVGPERRFRLGLVGIVPSRKGLHTALDVLHRLRSVDDRYTLSIKGRRPSEYPWMAHRPAERDYFREQFARIDDDPLLGAAVSFEPFGPDMDAWFSRIGIALSTSDFESFHFTLPDGAAHGVLPRSLSWPGADLLYPLRWLAPDAVMLAESIHRATQDPSQWQAEAVEARQLVVQRFAASRVLPELADVVLGRRRAEVRP
ncbi:hypothetical protein GCM10010977_00790 [Citricoccus zhacaiensis]|uniref:Glycosyltransferase family 1 protein n=1 Tax=Citricoccus zhacaiensis TaxID=489142 RepID=A0ABQ2LLK5_9MICC|nr:hypothetical protein [Citricoccus zhacaiensis]GGO39696.1 hypothetical protein GCM10010977_00790 [Citricoccus zhacaiensis]